MASLKSRVRVCRRDVSEPSAHTTMLPPAVLQWITPLALLIPAVLTAGPTDTRVHSSSFDWAALRALPPPRLADDDGQEDCEAPAAAVSMLAPLVSPPSTEIAQGYSPERLQLGQHIAGFKLTSFVRRIPQLPSQLPITNSATTPASLQVHPGVNADAVALFSRFALPGREGKDASEVLALPGPSNALALFDPRAAETAVSKSLLALPAAAPAYYSEIADGDGGANSVHYAELTDVGGGAAAVK